jgi:hypothetical protein
VAALASARHLSIPNPMIGLATSQRDRDGVVNGNQLTIGTVHDHLPVLAEVPRDATFARVVADLHKRRTEARRHRLPTGRLEQYAGGAVPYGIAVNFGRFGSPAPIPVHGGGTVLAMPVEEVGPVNLEEATTAAPALAWIASREGPTIRGFVIGISGLYEAATVARYAQALSTNALAVTQQPYRRLSEFVPF